MDHALNNFHNNQELLILPLRRTWRGLHLCSNPFQRSLCRGLLQKYSQDYHLTRRLCEHSAGESIWTWADIFNALKTVPCNSQSVYGSSFLCSVVACKEVRAYQWRLKLYLLPCLMSKVIKWAFEFDLLLQPSLPLNLTMEARK